MFAAVRPDLSRGMGSRGSLGTSASRGPSPQETQSTSDQERLQTAAGDGTWHTLRRNRRLTVQSAKVVLVPSRTKPGRIAERSGAGGNVPVLDDAARTDHSVVADRHAGQDDGAAADTRHSDRS